MIFNELSVLYTQSFVFFFSQLGKDFSRTCWYIEHWALQGFWEFMSHSDRVELVIIPHWSVTIGKVQGVWNEWEEYDEINNWVIQSATLCQTRLLKNECVVLLMFNMGVVCLSMFGYQSRSLKSAWNTECSLFDLCSLLRKVCRLPLLIWFYAPETDWWQVCSGGAEK